MKNRLYKIVIGSLLISGFLALYPTGAHAATLLLDKTVVGTGKQEVNVLIDTEKQEINTVSATLTFSSKNIVVNDVSDANSLINLWIEKPSLSEKNGKIHLSGIVPGGYNGDHGQLIKIYLEVKGSGEISFNPEEITILLNDGLGTETKVIQGALILKSYDSIATTTIPGKTISIPPENFTPIITSDPNLYSGKYILIFSTTNKGSGIDHYEVLETGLRSVGAWKSAESPYLLEDQSLNSDIYIRAVAKDKSFIVVKMPDTGTSPYKLKSNYLLFAVLLILLSLVIGIIIYRRKKSSG